MLGIGLAVLFGVSFVRGTIRVNLKQFFQMTTVILMVVVVQLAITGLHELSESQILPASTREMALIGPVVKNDIFFFVTILALAAAMMLLEWRKRRAPKTEGLGGSGAAQSAMVGAAGALVDDRIVRRILRFHSHDHAPNSSMRARRPRSPPRCR